MFFWNLVFLVLNKGIRHRIALLTLISWGVSFFFSLILSDWFCFNRFLFVHLFSLNFINSFIVYFFACLHISKIVFSFSTWYGQEVQELKKLVLQNPVSDWYVGYKHVQSVVWVFFSFDITLPVSIRKRNIGISETPYWLEQVKHRLVPWKLKFAV